MNEKIDFIITWVDGNDKEWQKSKNSFIKGNNTDTRDARYRDWNNLKYLFRGIEKFAPWVNNVYLVTCGQIPEWINKNNCKLKIIFHKDYINSKYLPTFNSNAIEVNFNKINTLSEKIVYFNDDQFIIDYVKPIDFFKNNLPCDSLILSPIIFSEENNIMAHIQANNLYFINNHLSLKKDNKLFNIGYRKYLLKNISLCIYNSFVGFRANHLPTSFLKSTFDEVWSLNEEELTKTTSNKFRSTTDVNQWLFEYYQMAKGKFYPRSVNFGKYFSYSSNNKKMYDAIKKQKYKVVCLNDVDETKYDFEKEKLNTINAFNEILPEKSSFEK